MKEACALYDYHVHLLGQSEQDDEHEVRDAVQSSASRKYIQFLFHGTEIVRRLFIKL